MYVIPNCIEEKKNIKSNFALLYEYLKRKSSSHERRFLDQQLQTFSNKLSVVNHICLYVFFLSNVKIIKSYNINIFIQLLFCTALYLVFDKSS